MKLMPKEFRVFVQCTTYYDYIYEAKTKEEATALAEKNLDKDFPLYEKLSNDRPVIYETTEVD